MSVTAADIAGYKAATWQIDPVHSEVTFTVRHMGISKVKGNFADFAGTIVTAENPADSSVEATVQVASVTTNNADRDNHLKTSDFFAAAEHPTFSLKSKSLQLKDAASGVLVADLTMRGVTHEVEFALELGGFGEDAMGAERLGISASTVVDRTEFGINFGGLVEKTGQLMVGNSVTIELELSAVLAS